MKKNKKPFLSRLFDSNIFLLILAFILSFVSWVVVTLNSDSNNSTKPIEDVPIEIQLPESAAGYTYFLQNTTKKEKATMDEIDTSSIAEKAVATVMVKGNVITAGSVTADNIKLTGKLNLDDSYLITPDIYKVYVIHEKKGIHTNYEIESVDPNVLKIYIDEKESKDFTVVNKLSTKSDSVPDDKYFSTTLQDPDITVTGPKTLLSKVAAVEVHGEINQVGKYEKDISYYDANGMELSENETTYFYPSTDKIQVTAELLSTKSITLQAKTENKPDGIQALPNVDPSKIKIAGPEKTLSEIKDNKIEIASLDFHDLSNEYFEDEYAINLPANCIIIADDENSSTPKQAKVTYDLSRFDSKTITVNITSPDDDYSYLYSPNPVKLKICGSTEELNKLTTGDITVTPIIPEDTKTKMKMGETVNLTNIKLDISFSEDFETCWVNNPPDLDNVTVTKK